MRGCYIRPIQEKGKQKPYRLICFDMETTQHQLVTTDPSSPAAQQRKKKHEPNFIAAKVACPECISNGEWKKSLSGGGCEVCGAHRTITFSERAFHETSVDKQVVSAHPLVAFIKWLLYELPLGYDNFAFSHYGGGYMVSVINFFFANILGRFDMILAFRELYMEKLNPQMLRKGNKLYEMRVKQREGKNPNVIFRDSYNLIPSSLASLVPTFGLEVEDKPFFPHLVSNLTNYSTKIFLKIKANHPDNYGRQIFPTPAEYLADGMMPEKKKQFDEWFAKNGGKPFLLDEELASYCTNDVVGENVSTNLIDTNNLGDSDGCTSHFPP